MGYCCAINCEEASSQSPFRKGGQEGFEAGLVRTTPSIGRGKISPHPSLSKRGVQPTWHARIGEAHPRSCPAASSFSTTFATDQIFSFPLYTSCMRNVPNRVHTVQKLCLCSVVGGARSGFCRFCAGLEKYRWMHD